MFEDENQEFGTGDYVYWGYDPYIITGESGGCADTYRVEPVKRDEFKFSGEDTYYVHASELVLMTTAEIEELD